jgi:outer membrane protein assembly factor BamB
MQRLWNPRTLATLAVAFTLFLCCKHQNRPPETPATPAGPSSVQPDSVYAFTTSSIDPDGDSLACQFDWGDSTLSAWSAYVPSGTVVSGTKTWTRHGAFRVRARAEDRHGAQTDWSSQLRVAVANIAPEIPRVPYGPDTGTAPALLTFGTVTSDANLDAISYQFDWGSDDTTAWSSPVPSGYAVYMTDTCISGGEYLLRVRARDTLGATTEWSDARVLRISGPKVAWRFDSGVTVDYSTPAIAPDGTVYFVCHSGDMYALDPDGKLRWHHSMPGISETSPTVGSDGRVYASAGSVLHSLAADGTPYWALSRGHVSRNSGISLVGDSLLLYPNPALLAMDREGDIRWESHHGNAGSQAIAEDGAVYLQTTDSLIALNSDGSARWSAGLPSGSRYWPPVLGANGVIYCAGHEETLYAFDENGNLNWACPVGDHNQHIYAAPALDADGMIYCGFRYGLRAVSSVGARKWVFPTATYVRTVPAVAADGTIYFGADDGTFYALNHDGTLKWSYHVGGKCRSSPTIGQDGRVYFASPDGYLYAFEGGSPPAASPWPMYLHDARHTGWAGTR